LAAALVPGYRVQLQNCETASGGVTDMSLQLPNGVEVAADHGSNACLSQGLQENEFGSVITFRLACDHVPPFPVPVPSDNATWMRLVQGCSTPGAQCSGAAVLTILDDSSCPYAAMPPPPPANPFCGEYEASGTNNAQDQGRSIHCAIPSFDAIHPNVTLAAGFEYAVEFYCSDLSVTPMDGYPWFTLLNHLKQDMVGTHEDYYPCGVTKGAYQRFLFRIQCFDADQTWELLRGCRDNEHCKATPLIYPRSRWADCSPPPPPPLPPPPLPPPPPPPPPVNNSR
jgi:hypothetical protein